MQRKLKVAILFGGNSVEHEVSVQSARSVVRAIDKDKFEVLPIGIDGQGGWHFYESQAAVDLFVSDQPLRREEDFGSLDEREDAISPENIDVVFPLVHGVNGEDGTLQGMLKLAQLPFVGPSVLSSAICMDKEVTKRLLKAAGLPVVPYVALRYGEEVDLSLFSYPAFVKPANSGSSVGIEKVYNEEALMNAIEVAFAFDSKVLVEVAVEGMEIECAILGNEAPIASLPSRVIPTHAYYSYEAKYIDPNGALFEVPARLDPALIKTVQERALQAYRVLECEGMARVDFFVTETEVFVNEVNTIPGFTSISMYPKMWEVSGLSFPALIEELIALALKRHQTERQLRRSPPALAFP